MTFEDLIDLWTAEKSLQKGRLEKPTHTASNKNRQCGDKVLFDLIVDDTGVVTHCKYDGAGCVLCIGSAVYLAKEAMNKSIESCLELDVPADFEISPGRKGCVALSVNTFRQALTNGSTQVSGEGAGTDNSGRSNQVS